jgi:Spy/CpxP family protein refolding chaperone
MLKATLLATSCALFIGSAAYAQTSDTTTAPSAPMEQQPQTSVKTENMFGSQSSDTATETNKVGFLEAKPGPLRV